MSRGLYLLLGAGVLIINVLLGFFIGSIPKMPVILQNMLINAIVIVLAWLVYRQRPLKIREDEKSAKPGLKNRIAYIIVGLGGVWLFSQSLMYILIGDRDIVYENVVEKIFTVDPGFIFGLLVTAAFALVLAPVLEEFLYRGIFYKGFTMIGIKNDKIRILLAAGLSALIFGTIHMNTVQFITSFVMGFYLCLVYELHGRIWLSIILHSAYNLTGFILNLLGMPLFLNIITLCIGAGIIIVTYLIYYLKKIKFI